jgi:hypothetical protein
MYVIDGFLNNATVIQAMRAAGLLAICYIRCGQLASNVVSRG